MSRPPCADNPPRAHEKTLNSKLGCWWANVAIKIIRVQRKSHQTKNFCLRERDEKFSSRVFYLGSSAQWSEDVEHDCSPFLQQRPPPSAQQDPKWSHINRGFHNALISSKSYPKLKTLSFYLPKAPSYPFPSGRKHHGKGWKLVVF